jgi:hypothetical protein
MDAAKLPVPVHAGTPLSDGLPRVIGQRPADETWACARDASICPLGTASGTARELWDSQDGASLSEQVQRNALSFEPLPVAVNAGEIAAFVSLQPLWIRGHPSASPSVPINFCLTFTLTFDHLYANIMTYNQRHEGT